MVLLFNINGLNYNYEREKMNNGNKISVYNIMSIPKSMTEGYDKTDITYLESNFKQLLTNITYMIKNNDYHVIGRDSILTDWEYDLRLKFYKDRVRFIQDPIQEEKGIEGIWDLYCTREQLENLLVLFKVNKESIIDYVTLKRRIVNKVFN